MASESELRVLVAQVAAAYFSNSHVRPSEIAEVFVQITASLRGVDDGDARSAQAGDAAAQVGAAALETPDMSLATPSVADIRRSIADEGLISFEDGRRYKTLKRHLATYGLTPAQYRDKWGLPSDYPMVCASSSAKRSALAKQMGLGRKGLPRVRNARLAKAARL